MENETNTMQKEKIKVVTTESLLQELINISKDMNKSLREMKIRLNEMSR